MKKRFNQDGGDHNWQRMLERYWELRARLKALVGFDVRDVKELAGVPQEKKALGICAEIDRVVGAYYHN